MVTTKKVEFLNIAHYMDIAKILAFMENKATSFLTYNKYILSLINKK